MRRRVSSQAGFTIIEVLIVLATAGLIMLIVFEAIPTLTRNSRNNQRKQDVQTILEAVSHYMLNNSGNMPQACGASSQQPCTAPNQGLQYAKLTFYDATTTGKVVISPVNIDSGITNTVSAPDNTEKVVVANYNKCDPDNAGHATTAAAGYRDVVALYTLEGGNNSITAMCQEMN